MSKASDKITNDINKYIDTMKETGRMPSVVYVTKQQFEELKIGLGKGTEKNWKPRIRSIPIEVQP